MKTLSLVSMSFTFSLLLFASCNPDNAALDDKNAILTSSNWLEEETTMQVEFNPDGTYKERYSIKDSGPFIQEGTWKWNNDMEISLELKYVTLLGDRHPIDARDNLHIWRFTELEKDRITGIRHAQGDAEDSGFAEDFTLQKAQ